MAPIGHAQPPSPDFMRHDPTAVSAFPRTQLTHQAVRQAEQQARPAGGLQRVAWPGTEASATGCAGGCGCGGSCGGGAATNTASTRGQRSSCGQTSAGPKLPFGNLDYRGGQVWADHGFGPPTNVQPRSAGNRANSQDAANLRRFAPPQPPAAQILIWRHALDFDATVALWVKQAALGKDVPNVFTVSNGLLHFERCEDAVAFVLKSVAMAKIQVNGKHPYKPCALVTCWQGGATVTCAPCPGGMVHKAVEFYPGVFVPTATCIPLKTTGSDAWGIPNKDGGLGKGRVIGSSGSGAPGIAPCPDGLPAKFVALFDANGKQTGAFLRYCDGELGCGDGEGTACADGYVCVECIEGGGFSCEPENDTCGDWDLSDPAECNVASDCACSTGDSAACMDGKCQCKVVPTSGCMGPEPSPDSCGPGGWPCCASDGVWRCDFGNGCGF